MPGRSSRCQRSERRRFPSQSGRRGSRLLTVHRRRVTRAQVDASAAVIAVQTGTCEQPVTAGAAVQFVVIVIAMKDVVASAARDRVVAVAAEDEIVARSA